MNTKLLEDLRSSSLDGWDLVLSFLPKGWEEEAKRCGAFQRARGIKDASTLLRVLLIHLVEGYSLRETSVRASESGLATISAPSLQHRLEKAGEWLRWLAEGVRGELQRTCVVPIEKCGMNVRAVDGTSISEPGSTGTDWRVHYSLQLPTLNCDHFAVTPPNQGESFTRYPIQAGDLLIGDRGYSHRRGVRHIVQGGGNVLVRVNWQCFPVEISGGKRFNPVSLGRQLRVMQPREWDVSLPSEQKGQPAISGRIVGIKKSRAATRAAEKALRQRYTKKGKTLSKWTLAMAAYIYVFTTVSVDRLFAAQVLELYRARWQIELAFKQLKSILGIGHLPKINPRSGQAWLHGKILVALLAQAIIQAGEALSPWGYEISTEWPEHPESVS